VCTSSSKGLGMIGNPLELQQSSRIQLISSASWR
jgi:hypothetical protein